MVRWFVPHDPKGLIALFGGVDKFVEQLMEFFDYSSTVAAALDVSGPSMALTSYQSTLHVPVRADLDQFNILPNPYYWAGNEVHTADTENIISISFRL